MPIYELILSIVYVILALFLIVVVILQSGKSSGLSGAIGGGSGDTFLAKNKSKSMDARLAKMTKWVAIVFMVLTLGDVLYCVRRAAKKSDKCGADFIRAAFLFAGKRHSLFRAKELRPAAAHSPRRTRFARLRAEQCVRPRTHRGRTQI